MPPRARVFAGSGGSARWAACQAWLWRWRPIVEGCVGSSTAVSRELPWLGVRIDPVPVRAPELLALNEPLARELGLDPDWLGSDEGVAVLAGNVIAEGSEPIAQAYAGHQFGQLSPLLGDGRAHLLGEIVDAGGRRRDVALKGSGRTPFSRAGDGRAAVGPVHADRGAAAVRRS